MKCTSRVVASEKRKNAVSAGAKRYVQRVQQDPAYKLKSELSGAARRVWTGKQFNTKCSVLADYTIFKHPLELVNRLEASAATGGITRPNGSIDHIIPQDFYDFTNTDDIARCWHPENIRIVGLNNNRAKSWSLNCELLQSVPAEAFPLSYPKNIVLNAARHDGGKDLYSRHVLSRN